MLSALRGGVGGSQVHAPPFLLSVFLNMKQVRLHWDYRQSDGMRMTKVFAAYMSPYREQQVAPYSCPETTSFKRLHAPSRICARTSLTKPVHEKRSSCSNFSSILLDFGSSAKKKRKKGRKSDLSGCVYDVQLKAKRMHLIASYCYTQL